MSPMLIALANATAAATTLERRGGTVTKVRVKLVVDEACDAKYADWEVRGSHQDRRIEIGPTFNTPTEMVVDWDENEHEVDDLMQLDRLLGGDE